MPEGRAATQPYGGLGQFDPQQFFKGGAYEPPGGQGNPSNAGLGMYGLPPAFTNWNAPSRYAFGPAGEFSQGIQPIEDFYRGELNKDYQPELFELARNQIDTGAKEGRRQQQQQFTRSGQAGGNAMSPMAGAMLQQEELARTGQLGLAAQQSVLQAQQMKSEAGRNLSNILSQRMQAMLAPAQFQSAQESNVPVGQAGPSILGPALAGAGSFLGGLSQ